METTEKKWFQKTGWIIVLVLLFFPIGLYLLWKNPFMGKGLKWIIFIGWFAFMCYSASKVDMSKEGRKSLNGSSGKKCCCRFNSITDHSYQYEWIDESECSAIGGTKSGKDEGDCY